MNMIKSFLVVATLLVSAGAHGAWWYENVDYGSINLAKTVTETGVSFTLTTSGTYYAIPSSVAGLKSGIVCNTDGTMVVMNRGNYAIEALIAMSWTVSGDVTVMKNGSPTALTMAFTGNSTPYSVGVVRGMLALASGDILTLGIRSAVAAQDVTIQRFTIEVETVK